MRYTIDNKMTITISAIKENIARIVFSGPDYNEQESLIVRNRERFAESEASTEQLDKLAAGMQFDIDVDDKTGQVRFCIKDARDTQSISDTHDAQNILCTLSGELTRKTVMRYTTGDEKPVIERVKTVDGEKNFIKNLRQVEDHEAYSGRVMFEWAEGEHIHGLGQGEDGIFDYRGCYQYLYQHNMRIPMPVIMSDRGYAILFDCTSLMCFSDTQQGSYMYLDTVPYIDLYFIYGSATGSGNCSTNGGATGSGNCSTNGSATNNGNCSTNGGATNDSGYFDHATDMQASTFDNIISGIHYLTGHAAMLPKWAFGYIQSKEQYYTAKELADVVRRYRELSVPLDCVVQDWNSWAPGNWGEKVLDRERYGDINERMQDIHNMNAHAMVSIWPNMNFGGENHTEMLNSGYLLNDLSTYDAFNEKARRLYFDQARKEMLDNGFEAWWCDSTEPFAGPDWCGETKREPWERFYLVGEEHKRYLPAEKANAYALIHAKGIYENQRKYRDDIRVLNLTRSGLPSSDTYGAVLWSGDTYASYETMRRQITEGLNMGLSGYPYWTLDIGGFFVVHENWQHRGCSCNQDPTPKWFWVGDYEEGIDDPAYRELYARWMQFGCFLPMFRSHGTDTPREIWNFGEKGDMFYDSIERSINLRYTLMPYIYSLAGMAALNDRIMMRALLFDFAADGRAAGIDWEYMFGPALLVRPITHAMYYTPGGNAIDSGKTVTCYLPECAGWYDLDTCEFYEGGSEIGVSAPIDKLPLFVKAGSIVPMKRGMQFADDMKDAPVELHIYPGCDGQFTLYDDEGNNYNYEKGEYSLIELSWDDKTRVLSISDRRGTYPGCPVNVHFEIYLLNELAGKYDYDGTACSIRA